MISKLVLIALIIYAVPTSVQGNCSLSAGRCLKTKSCESGEYEMPCADRGSKCCAKAEVPEEYRCRSKFGGQCINDCPETILEKRALDCDEGLSCCVYVK